MYVSVFVPAEKRDELDAAFVAWVLSWTWRVALIMSPDPQALEYCLPFVEYETAHIVVRQWWVRQGEAGACLSVHIEKP